jgi:hypothetical protein
MLVAQPFGFSTTSQVMYAELVDAWGWMSLGLATVAGIVAAWAARSRWTMAGLSATLVALAVMAAAVASHWDQGNWLSYNTLFVCHAMIAMGALAIAWHDRRAASAVAQQGELSPAPGAPLPSMQQGATWLAGSTSAISSNLAQWIVLVLAVRELDYLRWWSVGGFAVLVFTAAAAAWIFQRRQYLYAAALMVNVAGSTAWLESAVLPGLVNFVLANVMFMTLPVVAWLVIEQVRIRHRQFSPRLRGLPIHQTATGLAIGVFAMVVVAGLLFDAQQFTAPDVADWMPWAALAATALAVSACLWDTFARDTVARLYLLGFIAMGMMLDAFNLTPHWLLWTGNMIVAAYALATSYLWSRRRGLRALADQLKIPRAAESDFAGLAWLVPCNLFLVAMVVSLTGIVELSERVVGLRVLAAQALLSQVVSVALVARGDRRGVLQSIALALGAAGAAAFGWAWLVPGATGTPLNVLVVLAAALAAVAVLYGLGLGKLLRETSDWLAPARAMTPWLATLVAGSIVAILAMELYQFINLPEVDIAWPAILAVGLTLAGMSAAALAAAILPGRDPLGLSPRGRTLYVYGAEMLLALLFVHGRLTMPWLFHGFFQQYWPLIVMLIAFLGVGFAELCRRYRQEVLAEPLENTGALLPVLPVLGFWAADSRVDYSLLLVAVGVLYAGLSIVRRSFGFGVLAALAANGGLWYFLNRQEGLGFLVHPQIWMIPPAICILAAAYLNRSQLSDAQMTAARYTTSMAIYVSSTADIFVNGVAQNPWLPGILAAISLAGILAGVLLRVRAFLMLGTGFLGLALFTIIWYAAVDRDQTWIWYASGIVAGVLILALFAVFEKKRQEVLEVFERIKQWEA